MILIFVSATTGYAQNPEATAILKRDVGVWDVELKVYGEPGVEPTVTKGTETCTMLGEMWLVSQLDGEMMGQPMQGMRQTAFDEQRKIFVGSWIDTTSPHTTKMEGTWNEQTQTLKALGLGKNAMGGELKTQMVFTYLPDGTRTYTMSLDVNGQAMKLIEAKYTKRPEDKKATKKK